MMEVINHEKWDRRFLELATFIASWSKDPSTQVGAVIVNPETRHIISVGYNGFPRGIFDDPAILNDRPSKYALMVHAEENALLNAGQSVRGYTLYCTLFPCMEKCVKQIIQAGLTRVVTYSNPDYPRKTEFQLDGSQKLLTKVGIEYILYDKI